MILPFVNLFGQNKIQLGINTGVTYSSLRGSDILEDTDSKNIFLLVGISFEYYLKDNLSFKTNLNLDQKSISYERNLPTYSYVNNMGIIERENYIEKTDSDYYYLILPLLLKYDFGKNKNFFVNGGIYYAYLMKHKTEVNVEMNSSDVLIDTSKNSISDEENYNLKRGFSKNDLGISFGFGKSFLLNSKNELTIEIRDNLGFSNALHDSYNDNGNIKTNSLNLILNYSFGL